MSATRRWPARSGYGADVQIPFTLRGIDGLVSVRVERNDAPELVGSGPDSLGFPWCHAAVAYPAQGYDAARILADALARAKGESADDLREAIQATRGFQGASAGVAASRSLHRFKAACSSPAWESAQPR